ncbi:MAG: hypothetical protein IJ143_07565 [Neisseriaceae bacterium]|nr:hypothetical protein [Neisseriaceae bacterium]
MLNVWRNWFIDPESGLPWATVMMFPWLKYGATEKPTISSKIKIEMPQKIHKATPSTPKAKTTVSKKSTSSKSKSVSATAKKTSVQSNLPIKAPKNALVPVAVAEKTVDKPKTTVQKKTASTSIQSNEKKVLTEKSKAKTQTKETLPLDLPVAVSEPTSNTKKTVSKKVEFSNESEAVALASEKKFTPISTEKLPIEVQNLITQTNPSSPKAQIREVIALLSANDWASSAALADKLQYKASQLETLHLTPMVNSGQLALRYPQEINHPEQAYRTVNKVKK